MTANLLTTPKTILENVFALCLPFKAIKNKGIYAVLIVMSISAIHKNAVAQKAKDKLNQVNNTARNLAADAQLIFITGDDLNINGESGTWIYNYKSKSQGKVYEFWYEDGNIKQKPISNWDHFKVTNGMSALPDIWLNSDEVVSIAESNGGSSFRASHGGNAAIRISLLPSAFGASGDVPLLYPVEAWEISYRQNDTYFDITINAQSGEIITNKPIDERKATACELLSNMDSLARELTPDAKLYEIQGYVDLEGKSGECAFRYHSISRQATFVCEYHFSKIRRTPEENPPDHNYSSGIEIPDLWMDSDSAIISAVEMGLVNFMNTHPNGELRITLFNIEPRMPVWDVNYYSPSGYINYEVPAIDTENLVNKAQTHLEQLKALAKTYAADAELVFVTAAHGNISENGDGQWNYVFKSVSQQETYEFYSTITGYIELAEGVTSFFSKEDFLNAQPFPESWIGIDSALITTENSGGRDFRQNYEDWMIGVYLFVVPEDRSFNWDINYNSESTEQHIQFFINAKILYKVLVKELLFKADSLVETIDPGAKLVYIHAINVDIEGKAVVWKYYFKSSDNQNIYQVNIDNGDVFEPMEFSAPVNMEFLLGLDTLPGNWINSDSVINIVEGEGGFEFREEHPDWDITVSLRLRDGYSEPRWRIMYRPGPEIFWINAINPFQSTDWPKVYGGNQTDVGQSVQETSDGGFIITGYTNSFGYGMADTWLIKTDSLGNTEWDMTHGGPFNDYGRYVEVTQESDFLVAHNTSNTSGVFSGNLLHTYSNGVEKLGRSYSNGGNVEAYSIHKTTDNSYIMAGSSVMNEGEPSDFWLIKISQEGNLIWEKLIGGVGDDMCESMQQTSDGGYIMFGHTNSFGAGGVDCWLVKTDEEGNKTWDKTFGGILNEEGKSVKETVDGGYILAGVTESYGAQGQDCYLVKTDKNGNEVWSKTFGIEGEDVFWDVLQTSNGGYVMVGTTNRNGNSDVLVLKTDSAGNELGYQIIGEGYSDEGRAICETRNGSFVITGGTQSWGANGMDVFLTKIEEEGFLTHHSKIKESENIFLSNYPNPFSDETKIRLNIRNAGNYKIRIIDITGRETNVLLDGFLPNGIHQINWNGKSNNGKKLNPGIYIIELTGDINRKVRKFVIQ